MDYIIEMENITKRFPLTVANKGVNFSVRLGEIHALVGENGAGKTTLMKILYGLYQPDTGEIRIRGKSMKLHPRVAIQEGIGMVHQHFMLISCFTVTENIILGQEKGRVIDWKKRAEEVRELSCKYGLKIDPEARIEDLSVGEEQRVEILKALYRGAEVLILDEPTSVLSPPEVKQLFQTLQKLKEEGKAVILITHRLKEVFEVSDRVTVMKGGEVVGAVDTRETTEEELACLMIGRAILFKPPRRRARPGKVILKLENVSALSSRRVPALCSLSLAVREGEILGVGGVEGNGQTELGEVIAGLRPISQGKIILRDKDVSQYSARDMWEAGISHIPEDRLRWGIIEDYSIKENSILGQQFRGLYSRWWGIDFEAVRSLAERLIDQYSLQPQEPEIPVRLLSGGNQQRLVVGREMSKEPHLLIASQPTRGVDVGAIEFIHRKFIEARDQGTAVLLISADLSELLALSDRLLIMYQGRIAGEINPDDTDEETISLLMTGVK